MIFADAGAMIVVIPGTRVPDNKTLAPSSLRWIAAVELVGAFENSESMTCKGPRAPNSTAGPTPVQLCTLQSEILSSEDALVG